MGLTVLFMLLFCLFIASYKIFRSKPRGETHWGPVPQRIEIPFRGLMMVSNEYAHPHTGHDTRIPGWLNAWMTRIFIAIVLQCAAIFLISQFPSFQSPFWLGLVLQGYAYCSAFLFYASAWDDGYDY